MTLEVSEDVHKTKVDIRPVLESSFDIVEVTHDVRDVERQVRVGVLPLYPPQT